MTQRREFLAAAATGALGAPLLGARAIAETVPGLSYDSKLMRTPKYIDVEGVRTRYFDAGRGPALVLIHGGQWPATASADGYAAIFDHLAASYHVYAFDKLGMGYTDLPKTPAGYSMDGIIRHAYGFIRAVGLTRAIVAGHSRGALPAARIAADHPELVSHLIIFDTNALTNDDATLSASPNRALPTAPPTREQIRAADMKSILSYNKAIVTDAWVESEYQIAQMPKLQESVRGLAAAKVVWMRDNAERIKANPGLAVDDGPLTWWLVDAKHATLDLIRAGRMMMPTALIWGWNDNFAPLRFGLQAMETIAKVNPNTEMHIVNHASHFVFAEQPIEVTRLINSFVKAYG